MGSTNFLFDIIEEKTRWVFEKISFDSIITSRVRIARNLSNFSFPHNITYSDAKELEDVVLKEISKYSSNEIFIIRTEQIGKREKQILIERRIISNDFVENFIPSSVVVLPKERVSIMINEEDHLRIQSIQPGLNLKKAFKEVNKIDNFLQDKIKYAFSPEIGYLTACPTNIGTGIRGSVLVHLPALSVLNKTDEIFSAIESIDIIVRGLYGEGSKPSGNIFQLTTRETTGKSEKQIIEELEVVVDIILQEEKKAVEELKKIKKIKDKINKKIVKKYKKVNMKNFLDFFSLIYLGKKLNIVNIENNDFYNLFTSIFLCNLHVNKEEKNFHFKKNTKRGKIILNT